MRHTPLLLLVACAGAPATPIGTSVSHLGPVTALTFAGGELLSCSQAGVLRGAPGAERLYLRPDFRVLDMVAVADGLLLCGGNPGRSGHVAWVHKGGKLQSVRVAKDLVYSVTAAGKTAAFGCADGRVLVMTLPDLGKRHQMYRHTAPCRGVQLAPSTLCSVGRDSLVVLSPDQPIAAEPEVLQDHSGGVECVALSPDRSLLASGSLDGKLRLHRLDLPHGSRRLSRTWQRLGAAVRTVVFLPDGGLVAGLADGRLLRWAGGAAELLPFHKLKGPVYALAVRKNALFVGLSGRCERIEL